MPGGYVTTTTVIIQHQVFHRAAQQFQLLSKSAGVLCSCLTCSCSLRSSKIWLFYNSYLVASWMQLHNCRCYQKHLRLLMESLRALFSAPGGSGSIEKYVDGLVGSLGVSGMNTRCFRTNLHLADVASWGDVCVNDGDSGILSWTDLRFTICPILVVSRWKTPERPAMKHVI
jgi:hypothetical protein